MKRFKKAITLLLCVAMALSSMAGLTALAADVSWQAPTEGSGGIALPIFQEVTEYTYMLYEVAAQPYSDSQLILPELEKRTNVKIKLDVIPVDGYAEKVSIMVAAQELPDIVAGFDQKRVNDVGIAGLTLNVYDYIDYMPNFKVMLETEHSVRSKMFSATELFGIYTVGKKTSESPMLGWIMRQDILDKHNLSAPTSYDEFYELLVALKALYPESYPWTERVSLPFLDLAMQYGLHFAGSSAQYLAYDYDTNEYYLSYESPKLKEIVEFMRRAYEEKLIDPEAVLNTTEMWVAKMVTGSSFITYDWNNRCREFSEAAWANGNTEFLAAFVKPFAGGDDGDAVSYGNSFATGYNRVVNKNVKNPNELMAFLDYWIYSKDGAVLTQMGIEGQTFIWTDDAKTIWEYLPFDANNGNINDLKFYKDLLGNRDLTAGAASEYYGIFPAQEPEDWTLFNVKAVFGDTLIDPPPTLIFSEDESETLTEYSYLSTYFNDCLTKFAIGEMSMDEWDAFIDEVNGMGAPDVCDLYNANWNLRK